MSGSLPEAYRRGVQDFYGRDFIVSPDVLIPRPETEAIIDSVLNLAGVAYLPGVKPAKAKLPRKMRVLDVGTGSGCLAVTVKLELSEADVSACDLSEKALAVARQNAAKYGVEIDFTHSNLLDRMDNNFDVIMANLPYVDEAWDWLDKEALGAEPAMALYAADNGLALIKKLIDQIIKRKETGFVDKYLILEADPCQHEEIKKYALVQGLEHIETRGFVLLFGV